MAKLRKMLGAADSPYIISLMRMIETQSKFTIANWCIDYAEKFILPIYLKRFPDDNRPLNALNTAKDLIDGKIKLKDAKNIILHDCQNIARELESNPTAQAAVRAIGQASAAFHTPTHSLGLAFYGAAAIAYDRAGIGEKPDVYEGIAEEVCSDMLNALREVYIENEPNPAKINWNC